MFWTASHKIWGVEWLQKLRAKSRLTATPRKAQVVSGGEHGFHSPALGLFNKDAKTIARELASRKVSPEGPSSGMRMLTFYINRAGKNLPPQRLKVLENAKQLLHERIAAAKDKD